MFNFRDRSRIEAIVWIVAFIIIAAFAVTLDAHEEIDAFFRSHEHYQLDEIVTALAIAGAFGLAYSVLRLKDLWVEGNRRRLAEEKAASAAYHDGLTGLPNRRSLDAAISEFDMRRSRRSKHAAFSLDLTGLKKVNSELGQSGGDVVLKEIALRLLRLEPDDKVFHVGGDRFMLVTNSPSFSNPEAYAQRILLAICQPIEFHDISIEIAASLGYASFPDNARDFSSLVRFAESAMYEAKKSGPNVILAFTPAMDRKDRERAQMLADLKAAIQGNTISPHYQPLIDLKTGEVVGYEALARWEIRPAQFVSPCDFIPLAEETGLISVLTERLFLQACKDAITWPPHTILAFNLSASLLADRLLGLKILKILNETGLAPQRVELEVTESAIILDAESAQFVLNNLVQTGIKLALDDFGTGYSSLSQLSSYQFHTLKIDRSFISSFEVCEKQDKIVKAIIALGAGLGMKVTAEGIENESQLAKLEALGCDLGQGYLLGRPMSAKALRSHEVFRINSLLPAASNHSA